MTRAMFALTTEERALAVEAIGTFIDEYEGIREKTELQAFAALAGRFEGEPDADVEDGWSGNCPTCGTSIRQESR